MKREVRAIARAVSLAFGGAAALCAPYAAQAQQSQQLERVEITGSAIKRIDAETAVPVTIVKVDDLKKEGYTSIESIVSALSASQATQGTSAAVGVQSAGASFANLRGIGSNKTLVLLNGQRLANAATNGGLSGTGAAAVDINMIPLAAIDHIEVLRDGASALYGTDAIAGVINFITRRDYQGGEASIGATSPQHAGGQSESGNLAFGYGDLGKNRFNVFAVFDYNKQHALSAAQRPELLARSLKTSPTTSPGQYNQGGAVQNPTFPDCGAPDGIPLGDGTTNADCGYLYARKVDLIPETERKSVFVKASGQLTENHLLGLEYLYSEADTKSLIAGVPYGALWMNPGTKYYPGNGITPLPTVFALDPTYLPSSAPAGALPGVIKLRWRDTASGGRGDESDATQQRLIASLEGTVVGWDYKANYAYNENKLSDKLISGYTDGTQITAGILDGTLNPFGPQDSAGTALLGSAAVRGVVDRGKGTVNSFGLQGSRDIGDWFSNGRQSAIAIGAEYRREDFSYYAIPDVASLVTASLGLDPSTSIHGKRDVSAAYAELAIPALKTLDLTLAVRFDHYSDFGSTTNPKASFRWQPSKQILIRGSASKGFRAPSLYELYAPQTYTNSTDSLDDPVRCPGGTALPGVSPSDNCAVQFEVLNGGNPNLKPEKSKNWNFGILLQPTPDFNAGLDFWWIRLTQQIGTLDDLTVFGNPTKYSDLFHRAPDGSLSSDGSLCPGPNCGYVSLTNLNLGDLNTNGVDLSTNYRLHAASAGTFDFGLQATYITKYEQQLEVGGPFFPNVGVYFNGAPVFRWQFMLSANWSKGPWGAGLANHYKSGYIDSDPSNTVGDWSVWDLFGSWQPTKQLALNVGVRNLLDTKPPYSNQTYTFQVGYDPRFTDPTGRTYYARATYRF